MYRDFRLLHRRRELLRHVALDGGALVVSERHGLLRHGNRTDVLLHERFQRVEVHVAHDGERKAVGVRIELPVDRRQGFEAELVDDLGRNHLAARVVAVGHVDEFLLHQVVGIRLHVVELRAQHLHQRVVVVLVEARLREIQVEQLHHRFEVFGRAVAVHGAGIVLHRGLNRSRLARKLFLEIRRREFADARHRVECRHHLAHVELLVREDRQSAFGHGAHAHLVGLVGRGLHDYLHAVGERPLGRAERGVLCRFLYGRTFQYGAFRDQRLLDGVVLIRLDFGVGDFLADGEQLLGRRIHDAFLFGRRDDDHLIAGIYDLLGESVDRLDVDHLDQHAVQLPLGLGVGHRGVLRVVVQIGLYELAVAAVVAVGVGAFGAAHQVVLGAFEFALREAVAADFLHFGVDGFETFGQFAVLRHGHERRRVERRNHADFARTHACAEERCVGFHRNLLQTCVFHGGHVGLYDVEHFAVYQVVHLFGKRRTLHEELDFGTLHFGIGVDADDRVLIVGNGDRLLPGGVGRGNRNVAHERLDLVFYGIHVDVTDHDDRLIIGAVPLVVEVLQLLVVEALQSVEVADQVAVLVFCVLTERLKHLHGRTPRRAVAGAQLLHDDAALGVDLLRFERDEVRPVVQDQQGAVDDAFARSGDVLHHVGRLVPAGAGIEVGAEFHAYFFEILRQHLAGEVLGAVEGHVFEEVGETLLGIVLLNGADVVQNVEVGLSFRLFVVADVVGHSVFELARADVLVRRNRLLRIELGRCACHCECRDDEHGDFSHN